MSCQHLRSRRYPMKTRNPDFFCRKKEKVVGGLNNSWSVFPKGNN